MAHDAVPSRPGRLKRFAIFVAIVWGVAASFVAIELLSLAGSTVLLRTGPLRSMALADVVRQSTTCAVTTAPTGSSQADTAMNAWLLGVTTGMNARVSESAAQSAAAGDDPQSRRFRDFATERAARTSQTMQQIAAELGVPQPAGLRGRDRIEAPSLFTQWVEADEIGTTRALAAKYSSTTCHVFKLGAYWGYAMEVRMAMPGERSLLAAEISYHAEKAGVPGGVWEPAFASAPADAEAAANEIQQLTIGVTRYLKSAR